MGPTSPPTDIFVARQPIFDVKQRVFAYELLFRSGPENYFRPGSHPDLPTSSVISNGMFVGLGTLTDQKPAFINFSREPLVNDFAMALPAKQVVIELVESIEPDADVLAACKRLKTAGYRLALDHHIDSPARAPLVELADFLKVDVLATSSAERAAIGAKYAGSRHRILAERVETRETQAEALKQGFHYFQGYFFSRPTMVASKTIPGFRLNYLRILKELNRPDVDMRRIEEVVKQEASMTFRLLRRVNSAAYGFRMETSALRHALVLLGEREIRLCATVWSMSDLARDLPSELVVVSTLRARLGELLAPSLGMRDRSMDMFLLGMFSTLDAILEQPMDQIAATLPLAADIRDALVGQPGPLRAALDLIIAYEQGRWDDVPALAAATGVNESAIPTAYLDAVAWTRGIFQGNA